MCKIHGLIANKSRFEFGLGREEFDSDHSKEKNKLDWAYDKKRDHLSTCLGNLILIMFIGLLVVNNNKKKKSLNSLQYLLHRFNGILIDNVIAVRNC